MFSLLSRFSVQSCKCKPIPPFRSFTSASLRSKANVQNNLPRPPIRAPVEKSQAERINAVATRIYEAGRNELYKDTTSGGYRTVAYAVMAVSYGAVGYLYSTELWNIKAVQNRGLHWSVAVAYQVTMGAWGVFAAFAFMRTVGLVKSMKLVRVAGKVQLETLVSRPIPFLRPSKVISEPHQLTVNRAYVYAAIDREGMIVASEGQSLVSRLTRMLFYKPFANTRKLFGGVGRVPVIIGESGSRRFVSIDTDGQFSNGGQDLMDISKDDM